MSKKTEVAGTKESPEVIKIQPPNFQTIQVRMIGTAPLMQARFSKKVEMMTAMAEGSTGKKGKKRAARDFEQDMRDAIHVSSDGWYGHPASAIRNACIDVCRMVGHKMTFAKMSIFVESDGLDATEGQPLVRLIAGEPERSELPARNANGSVDIRVRPMWRQWEMRPVIRFDRDQFSPSDVINLISRAGMQVGIGEGRPFSKMSNGLDMGTWRIETV